MAMEVGKTLGGTIDPWQAAGLLTPSLSKLIGKGLKAFQGQRDPTLYSEAGATLKRISGRN